MIPAESAARADDTAPGAQVGVLLVNLGTPDAPTPSAVRRYLAEFLSDRRVIDTPRVIWLPILYGVILRLRPSRSARAYAAIWTPEGSPLRVNSLRLARRLEAGLRGSARVHLAMRYGEPSVRRTIGEMMAAGVRRVLVLPLYPQYSATSTGAVVDAVADTMKGLRWPPELRMINDYHRDPLFIDALAASVHDHWRRHGRAERLLLSFHGIPQRYVDDGDPYLDQCRGTAAALATRLDIDPAQFVVAYQSRVGREPWLQPYTDVVLTQFARDGVRSVQVLCPGFAVDCLETLEEIALRARETFLVAGGERFEYIAALNDDDRHVAALAAIVERNIAGWSDDAGARATAAA